MIIRDTEDQVAILRSALSESQVKMRQWKSKYYKCRAELVEEMARTRDGRQPNMFRAKKIDADIEKSHPWPEPL